MVYLNDDWHDNDGGKLRLYWPNSSDVRAEIAPVANRLVFFWPDESNPHEVLNTYRVRGPRLGEARPESWGEAQPGGPAVIGRGAGIVRPGRLAGPLVAAAPGPAGSGWARSRGGSCSRRLEARSWPRAWAARAAEGSGTAEQRCLFALSSSREKS